MPAHPRGQQPGQRGQHRPIRPRQIRPANLTTQDRDLVTQNEQLRGLRRVRSREPRQPPKHLNHRQVQHPNHHDQIMAESTNTGSQTVRRGFGTGHALALDRLRRGDVVYRTNDQHPVQASNRALPSIRPSAPPT